MINKQKLRSTRTTVGSYELYGLVSSTDTPLTSTPIVLVHGLSMSSKYMIPLAQLLASNHRVYLIDLPGFGQSSKPRHVLTIREHADVLSLWMEQNGIEKPVILGNSLGCQIIAELAIRYPGQISQAILTGPTMDPHARNIFREFGRLMLDISREPLSFIPVLVQDYFAAGFIRTVKTAIYGVRDRIETKLPRITIPTLIVRGEKDPIVPLAWAEEACHLLPRGQTVTIKAAAHVVNFAAPDALARTVNLFLAENAS